MPSIETSVAEGEQICFPEIQCRASRRNGASSFGVRVLLVFMASAAAFAQQYVISTVAGGVPPATPVPAVTASIGQPEGVVTDSNGNLYFTSIHCLFKLDASGVLTRAAGNAKLGYSGDNGPATGAQLSWPYGAAVDSAGYLYIADNGNNRIRKVSPSGTIITVAGDGSNGYSGDGGPATSAQLSGPAGVAVDGSGNLYIADSYNQRIRKVSPSGIISTLAGGGTNGYSGDGGPATSAEVGGPAGLAVDGAGNLYIADSYNQRVRKVSPSGIISTVVGDGTWGDSGDGGPAASAEVGDPIGVAVDGAGSLYIADAGNGRIRKVSPGGIITTVAGNGTRSEEHTSELQS